MAFKSLCHSVGLVRQEKMGSSQRVYVRKTSLDLFKKAREAPENFCNNSNQQKRKEMLGITHPNQLQHDKFSALSKFSICTESEKAERSNKITDYQKLFDVLCVGLIKLKYENTKHY